MKHLHIDVETYSAADLPRVGAHAYARDPSTRLLLVAWAIDDGPIGVVDILHGEPFPPALRAGLMDPGTLKWAHNAAFERVILEQVAGLACDPTQWRCTMVWALALGLPGGLDAVAEAVNAGERKADPNKRLVRIFSTPAHGGPEAPANAPLWPEFVEYNRQDVATERAVHAKLSRWPVPDHEWALWGLDQRINDRGWPVDVPFVAAACTAAERAQAEAEAEAAELTGLANPNSRAQVLGWLQERGQDLDDLRAETVEALIAAPGTPAPVRQVLALRQEMAATSPAKYAVLARATCPDGRLRGTLQFHGARTGRWSGRLFQPQNLPRGTLSAEEIPAARALVEAGDLDVVRACWGTVSGVLSSLVRSALRAPPGRQFVVADLASIESVMLAWAAESDYQLDLFRQERDPYIDFATRLFGVAYEDVTREQRNFAKPAVLGCGYGLGARGLAAYAQGFGLTLTEMDAARHVSLFREAYPAIPRLWARLEQAAFTAVADRTTTQAARCTLRYDTGYLFLDLPAGRALAYPAPRLRTTRGRTELVYSGREGKRMTVSTHPGKLVENIVQAIARDVLVAGLVRALVDGLDVVGHVHDEIVVEADAADATALPRLEHAMSKPLRWCPDAPIRAKGWAGEFYGKD